MLGKVSAAAIGAAAVFRGIAAVDCAQSAAGTIARSASKGGLIENFMTRPDPSIRGAQATEAGPHRGREYDLLYTQTREPAVILASPLAEGLEFDGIASCGEAVYLRRAATALAAVLACSSAAADSLAATTAAGAGFKRLPDYFHSMRLPGSFLAGPTNPCEPAANVGDGLAIALGCR